MFYTKKLIAIHTALINRLVKDLSGLKAKRKSQIMSTLKGNAGSIAVLYKDERQQDFDLIRKQRTERDELAKRHNLARASLRKDNDSLREELATL